MENKNYGLAFLIVFAIVCLGVYLAISSIRASQQETVIWLESKEPTAAAASPLPPTPTPVIIGLEPTLPPLSSPIPLPTPLPGNTPLIVPTPTLLPPTPTPLLPTATPSPRPTSTPRPPTPTSAQPTATPAAPTPPGGYIFEPVGPPQDDLAGGCFSQMIYGYVADKEGNRLEGVRVKSYVEWGYEAIAKTKGGVDLGYYDRVIGGDPVPWYLVIVNEAGQPISPVVEVKHMIDSQACWHRLDWQKVR